MLRPGTKKNTIVFSLFLPEISVDAAIASLNQRCVRVSELGFNDTIYLPLDAKSNKWFKSVRHSDTPSCALIAVDSRVAMFIQRLREELSVGELEEYAKKSEENVLKPWLYEEIKLNGKKGKGTMGKPDHHTPEVFTVDCVFSKQRFTPRSFTLPSVPSVHSLQRAYYEWRVCCEVFGNIHIISLLALGCILVQVCVRESQVSAREVDKYKSMTHETSHKSSHKSPHKSSRKRRELREKLKEGGRQMLDPIPHDCVFPETESDLSLFLSSSSSDRSMFKSLSHAYSYLSHPATILGEVVRGMWKDFVHDECEAGVYTGRVMKVMVVSLSNVSDTTPKAFTLDFGWRYSNERRHVVVEKNGDYGRQRRIPVKDIHELSKQPIYLDDYSSDLIEQVRSSHLAVKDIPLYTDLHSDCSHISGGVDSDISITSATVLTRDGYYRLHPVQSLLDAPLLHPIHPRPVYLSRPSTQYLDFTAASVFFSMLMSPYCLCFHPHSGQRMIETFGVKYWYISKDYTAHRTSSSPSSSASTSSSSSSTSPIDWSVPSKDYCLASTKIPQEECVKTRLPEGYRGEVPSSSCSQRVTLPTQMLSSKCLTNKCRIFCKNYVSLHDQHPDLPSISPDQVLLIPKVQHAKPDYFSSHYHAICKHCDLLPTFISSIPRHMRTYHTDMEFEGPIRLRDFIQRGYDRAASVYSSLWKEHVLTHPLLSHELKTGGPLVHCPTTPLKDVREIIHLMSFCLAHSSKLLELSERTQRTSEGMILGWAGDGHYVGLDTQLGRRYGSGYITEEDWGRVVWKLWKKWTIGEAQWGEGI
ncbi:hypothetical protein ADUPG1_000502 [Aduncisulcus paluster]|uniref:Uncharacterized protein n=1 Tax=Aduncisulcus paluster TaxID=2918883 RepID=A0ABQ5KAJ7_9EUKA|nr:hypothetical protein ADUPG1_000502 [Aduncisulcus paluster]